MKQRFFSFFIVAFFSVLFFSAVHATAVFAVAYCSFDYSSGVGVGRCEQYLASPYNPWKYLASSDKQLKQETSSASWTWPTSSSGKQGTRFCINGICAPFFPKVLESTVKTGEAGKDAICKGLGQNTYTTCADVNVAIKGKPARYEWGTIIRTDGAVPKNWNSEYWNYFYYPQNYKYSNAYPCGFWSGYASTSLSPYYKPRQYVIQTLSVTQNMPDKYNFHTEYLHLSQGLQLCILRTFMDTGAYQDNWVWLTPQWPAPASVTALTANGEGGTAWIAPGKSTTIDWATDRATQLDVSSSQYDIPSDLADQSKYNFSGNIYGLTPHKDTTYKVTASNAGGSASKSVAVKINKPIIWGLAANGVRDKISVFVGQTIRLDWATDSAEEIWINELDSTTNNTIKKYPSGTVTNLQMWGTKTFTLRAWNQQWGWGDEQPVTVEVQYLDIPKALHCGADSAVKAGTTGITFGTQWGTVAAFFGSLIAPGVGTAIGGVGGFIGGLVVGGVLGVANFVMCYFYDSFIGPDLIAAIQGAIIKGGLSVQGTPTFLPPIPPPSWTPPSCPSCTITKINDVPFPSTIPTKPPGGWALVYDGGADPVANALQKRNAEIGAWMKGTEEVATLQALKDQGIQYVKVNGSMPSHETIQEIRGVCGRLVSCLVTQMNASLGYPNGDASAQIDVRKKWTDSTVKKIFGIP